MKKSWLMVIVIAALGIVSSGMSRVIAQAGPVAGGYAEASSSDPEVVSAARYAVRRQGQKQGARISLVSIRRAEVQVVAGLNYRLGLRVNLNGKPRDVTAVVYKNLGQKYSLSEWKADATAGSNATLSNSTIEQLVKALAEAYTSKSLGKLDTGRPYWRKVRIVVEHSLADDNSKNKYETKDFQTLKQAEQWLKSRERDEGMPARQSKPLLRCRSGVCTYNFDGGILHNNLYLQKISYGYRNGRPYIKTIFLLDGN